jgi:hypothetical protein
VLEFIGQRTVHGPGARSKNLEALHDLDGGGGFNVRIGSDCLDFVRGFHVGQQFYWYPPGRQFEGSATSLASPPRLWMMPLQVWPSRSCIHIALYGVTNRETEVTKRETLWILADGLSWRPKGPARAEGWRLLS